MKAEAKAAGQPRPVVVWESRTESKRGNVIALPARDGGSDAVDREAAVTAWTVGPSDNPAIVTQVSSGFGKSKAAVATPQANSMRLAA
ncbi:hypothetical protein BAG01nite_35620 [Brevibacillus agri]|uniref:Uncharacterized protein n=1 Tax=Brevibacillus agri TaxID=51101 RepID=A0A3M8APW8_9BACL|nr:MULTISPECIES: hypothetical protein [Brevibacillus]MBY0055106.1 hypothetical protein [Brevibacillus agri]MDR9506139.1 hypothetical protein [Brevibacillus agri]MED4572363.1 hypothetical protein [Brevibacillus agri]QAV11382.1 hypothetical protein BA6348_00370 [Brevibacillus agri]QHZ58746.1 hypothetical protein M655_025715 [Brevibacillus sp. NSP2.1]